MYGELALAPVAALAAAAVLALLAPGLASGMPRISQGGGHQHPQPAAPAPTGQSPSTPQAPTVPTSPKAGPPNLGPRSPFAPGSTSGPIEVYARRVQDVDKLFVTAIMHVPGTLVANASVAVPGSRAKVVRFRRFSSKVPAHIKTKIRLRVGRPGKRAIKRALRAGERLNVDVAVTGRDRAADKSAARATRLVRLRFEGAGAFQNRMRWIVSVLNRLLAGDLAKSAVGERGPRGPQGAPGPEGPPGRSALSELQPGETIRGTVGGQTTAKVDTEVAFSTTFQIPVPVGLDDRHVTVDGFDEESNECTGSFNDPQAAPGYVCIYPIRRDAVLVRQPSADPSAPLPSPRGEVYGERNDGSQRWGFQVLWVVAPDPYDPTAELVSTALVGNWAYTAPGTPSTPGGGPGGGHGH
jgi:hypothetical protein